MLNVLIIEDEQLATEELKSMLIALRPDIKIVAIIRSIDEAIAWFQKNEADLIFMDIHLTDGNSFQIFEQVKINTPIIFTTAYDEYAIKAFKVNSIDYLLKPFGTSELATALAKFDEAKSTIKNESLGAILKSVDQQGPIYQKRFMVTSGEAILSIPVEEVAYFMGDGKHLFLFSKDGKKYILDSTLTKLEEVTNPTRFFRINRKFIVNFSAINEMVAYSKSRVKLELTPPLPSKLEAIVSVDRSGDFKKWLNR
ncbi:LytTR family DNA-binding domain-containing protein [Flammeovirgaceae bacterium SG7u.111]|nr:LytTR family DNA-binding domain-containing protein [Flammeovirgaceae bacterium SG7u.132]WPO35901.1 LytTR family DNA-binding domain-containing protein [Flammeovirgaceae bacterium SG7u.111]